MGEELRKEARHQAGGFAVVLARSGGTGGSELETLTEVRMWGWVASGELRGVVRNRQAWECLHLESSQMKRGRLAAAMWRHLGGCTPCRFTRPVGDQEKSFRCHQQIQLSLEEGHETEGGTLL